jgi:hypothetical protein
MIDATLPVSLMLLLLTVPFGDSLRTPDAAFPLNRASSYPSGILPVHARSDAFSHVVWCAQAARGSADIAPIDAMKSRRRICAAPERESHTGASAADVSSGGR